MRSWGGYK